MYDTVYSNNGTSGVVSVLNRRAGFASQCGCTWGKGVATRWYWSLARLFMSIAWGCNAYQSLSVVEGMERFQRWIMNGHKFSQYTIDIRRKFAFIGPMRQCTYCVFDHMRIEGWSKGAFITLKVWFVGIVISTKKLKVNYPERYGLHKASA